LSWNGEDDTKREIAAGFDERRSGVAGLRKKCRCGDDVELESGGLMVTKEEHGLDWWCWCGLDTWQQLEDRRDGGR
jgi:hypothetical protein